MNKILLALFCVPSFAGATQTELAAWPSTTDHDKMVDDCIVKMEHINQYYWDDQVKIRETCAKYIDLKMLDKNAN